MKKIFPPAIASLLFATLFLGCRKKESTAPEPVSSGNFTGCRITRIVESGADTNNIRTYNFIYNDDGTVGQISAKNKGYNDETVIKFTYKPGCIIAFAGYQKDSLVLDAQNRVTYIDHHSYNGGPALNSDWEKYEYDSAGYVRGITYFNHNMLSAQYYHWQNGDILWRTWGTEYTGFLYDTRPYNTGNITTSLANFERYGRAIITNKHLYAHQPFENTDDVTYDYMLDSDGRITQIKRVEGSKYVFTTDITYECK